MLNMIRPVRDIPCPRFFRRFEAPEQVDGAVLKITGLGVYTAYLNGKRIGGDYLAPGFNDYDDYVRVQTYDVRDYLEKDNLLEVIVGNGWYRGRIGFGEKQTCRWGEQYYLGARLEMTSGGDRCVVETDDSWKATLSCLVTSDIYDGETRDDTREPGEACGCTDADRDFHLVEQFSPCIRIVDTLRPELVCTPAGEKVLDFGQNFAGIVRFHSRMQRGQKLYMQAGEVLQGGNFYRDNLRSALAEYTYISDGNEKDVEMLSTFYGFRYMKVEGLEQVCPEDFTGLVLSSDLRHTLEVETGHPGINQLMHNSLWGQMSNFLDVPTDCPQRDERLGWTADTQVFVNTACYQMDCKDFYRKYMRDLRVDQVRYGGGDLPAYSPSLKGSGNHGGAVWADAGTIIPWNIYKNYGDVELLRENYPMMRDYCEWLIRKDQEDGGTHVRFSAFTFGDWLAQDGLTPQSSFGGTEPQYIQGVYYMNSLNLTAMAAKVLGEDRDAEHYGRLADEVQRALMNEYVTGGGRLAVETQTAYVLALRYGLYRNRETMIRSFENRLTRDFCAIRTGVTGTYQILPVLFECGMPEMAYRILLRESFPGWLYCVNLGATTIWERWNSLDSEGRITGTSMNSLNHYAYGSVCEAIYGYVMGLRSEAPGWKKARIAPVPDGRLGHARIAYDSPAGRWEVSWRIQEDGLFSMCVTVPEGAEATVVLPAHPDGEEILLSGESREWTYRPALDYAHPFHGKTRVADILACPQARLLLEQAAPKACARAVEQYSEFPIHTLEELLENSGLDAGEREALLERFSSLCVLP